MTSRPAPSSIVIVGGGLAGAKAAEALRGAGFDGLLTLLSDETHLPYERPPLSKGYLAGSSPFDEAVVHPAQWYEQNHVALRRAVHASAIDAAAHRVTLSDGSQVDYDKLLLATGAIPKRLGIPGADSSAVRYLRTREDADRIRATFGPGKALAVIGAGWIGLEVASVARQADTAVTIIETAQLPLIGVLGAQTATVFADLHRAHGVDLRLGAQPQAITPIDGRETGVRLADGSTVAADAVVVGIGVAPSVALAETAGLNIDNGVLVDASLRTSDPDIYAVGDIANHDHPTLGERIRVEHWATALKQPAVAAAAMLGAAEVYDELPYFFSDQYDLGMEYVGHASPDDRVVVRGDLQTREFVAFWLDDHDRIRASMNVNVWDVVDEVKPLIRGKVVIDTTRLVDPSVGYADLARD